MQDIIISNISGFILGFIVNYLFDKYKRTKQESNEFSQIAVLLKSNIFESYFTDESINVSCELSNQSPFHWHDITIDIYSSIFINENPIGGNIEKPSEPYFKRLSLDIPFIKSNDSYTFKIPYQIDTIKVIPNKIVAGDIIVADGLFNPLKFLSVLNSSETFVKMLVKSKVHHPYFPRCLYESFFKKQMFSVLQNLFKNSNSKFGGIIDYIIVTGKSRVKRKDVQFLKVIPVVNVWISTKKTAITHSHDIFFINSCFGLDVDFIIENNKLCALESQTYLKHSKPNIESIKSVLHKKKLGFDCATLRIGDDINNIELSVASISSEKNDAFKNIKMSTFGEVVQSPALDVNF